MYETKIWIDCRLQKYLELQDDEERQKHCWEREGDDGDGHKIPDRYKIVTKYLIVIKWSQNTCKKSITWTSFSSREDSEAPASRSPHSPVKANFEANFEGYMQCYFAFQCSHFTKQSFKRIKLEAIRVFSKSYQSQMDISALEFVSPARPLCTLPLDIFILNL